MAKNNNEKHKIVIVGGGAAGLELATSLGRKLGKKGLAEVTLIDAASTHIWKPLLHEVAAGTLDESEQVEYLPQGHRNHFYFRLGKMEGLDRKKKEIYVSPTLSDSGEELIPGVPLVMTPWSCLLAASVIHLILKGLQNIAYFWIPPHKLLNFKSNCLNPI